MVRNFHCFTDRNAKNSEGFLVRIWFPIICLKYITKIFYFWKNIFRWTLARSRTRSTSASSWSWRGRPGRTRWSFFFKGAHNEFPLKMFFYNSGPRSPPCSLPARWSTTCSAWSGRWVEFNRAQVAESGNPFLPFGTILKVWRYIEQKYDAIISGIESYF